MKRLIVCCDGTWQTLENEFPTNVVKIAQAIDPVAQDGIAQIVYYHPGLGTRNKMERKLGGAFGWGIDQDIKDAYTFLCLNYAPGDEIYFFGFSRGAYIVRSLAGLINCSGLVMRQQEKIGQKIRQAYDNYRNPDPAYHPGGKEAKKFRSNYTHESFSIKLLACWDTVGSLGIPDVIPLIPIDRWINKKYKFYDTKLSSIIDCALHAVAIDEIRRSFDLTPMTLDDELNFIIKSGFLAFTYQACNKPEVNINNEQWQKLVKEVEDKAKDVANEIRQDPMLKKDRTQLENKLKTGLSEISKEISQAAQTNIDEQLIKTLVDKITNKLLNFLETTPLKEASQYKPNTHTILKQTWFPGAHSCVGGGQEPIRGLSDAALQWMIEQIGELKSKGNLGLEFNLEFVKAEIKTKYDTPFDNDPGIFKLAGIMLREVICQFDDLHESVRNRWQAEKLEPWYRPANLQPYYSAYLERKLADNSQVPNQQPIDNSEFFNQLPVDKT